LRAVVRYANGSVSGSVADRTIKVDGKDVKLSALRSIAWEAKPRVVFADGRSVEGAVAGLDGLEIQLGKETVKLNLQSVQAVQFESSAAQAAVRWTLVARQDGKEITRLSGTLEVQGLESLAGFIQPPALAQGRATVELAGPVADVAVGGAGRYLVLHLPKQKQLAVFDVNQAKVVKTIPAPDDGLKFAAGMDKLLLVYGKDQNIERWSLTTFEREAAGQLNLKVPVVAVALGSASQGPLLVEGCDWPNLGEAAFFDIHDLKRLDFGFNPHDFLATEPNVFVRASANGKVFANQSYQGLQSCVLRNGRAQRHSGKGGNWPVPAPDGKEIFTTSGQLSEELKEQPGVGGPCWPAHHGPFYLNLALADRKPTLAIHRAGQEKPLTTVTTIAGPDVMPNALKGPMAALDKRIHLVPEARLLIVISASLDRLLLERVELAGK
jgi:hypothetical protein